MLWSNFEIEFASSEEYSCDLLVTDEREGVDLWRVWEASDDDSTLVVEDEAPEAVFDYCCEQDGWEDVRWAVDAERTRIKEVVREVREETVFYIEEPPELVFEEIGRLEAMEILERRGLEPEGLDDAWYYPRRNRAEFLFTQSDAAGEVYTTSKAVRNLDNIEQGLVDGEWPDDDEDDGPSVTVLQQQIYENSDFGELKAGVLACWKTGITENVRIADILDAEVDTISTTVWQINEKMEQRRWEQEHVYPYALEEKRPDDLLMYDE